MWHSPQLLGIKLKSIRYTFQPVSATAVFTDKMQLKGVREQLGTVRRSCTMQRPEQQGFSFALGSSLNNCSNTGNSSLPGPGWTDLVPRTVAELYMCTENWAKWQGRCYRKISDIAHIVSTNYHILSKFI